MQLRVDQELAVHRALTAIETGRTRILFDAATGWGKTLVLVETLRRICADNPSIQSIHWAVHRNRLLLQGFDRMFEHANHLIGKTNFLSIASSTTPSADILVIDEAHHDAARTYYELRNKVQPKLMLAASATPNRTDGKGLLFDAVIEADSIDTMIADGRLSSFEHVAITGDKDPGNLLLAYLSDPCRWGSSLLFVARADQARSLVGQARDCGVSAAVALGDSDKEAAVAAFAAGRIQLLVSCHALFEGLDIPLVKTVFVRDSNRVVVHQAVGRALRRFGQKVATVVQFAEAQEPFFAFARPAKRWCGPPSGPWLELPSPPTWTHIAQEHRTNITDIAAERVLTS